MSDDEDRPTAERVRALADALVATEERPVDPSVSPWLGEAAAVAVDAAEAAAAGTADEVVRERVGHVRDLLSDVEDTGDDEADERVATARRLAGEILEGDEDGGDDVGEGGSDARDGPATG